MNGLGPCSSCPALGRASTSFLLCCAEDVDGRAFAAPKGLRPRRRDKPGHDEVESYRFDLRLVLRPALRVFDADFFDEARRAVFFFGTLAPSRRASDSPIATA